jgi:hypothetical protein|tara:strand:+ start:59 stop:307 length:249 start_codon:yes stop_codon:yes gene_type:complete
MECLREVIVEREGVRSVQVEISGSPALALPMSWSPMSACVEIIDRLITMERQATEGNKDRTFTIVGSDWKYYERQNNTMIKP